MVYLSVLTAFILGLFTFGYYIGNQLGRTAHIRASIQDARERKVISRIDNRR